MERKLRMTARAVWLSLVTFALGLALVVAPRSARAQIDAERFKPAVTNDAFVTVEGSNVRPRADPFEMALLLNYSRNSLVFVDGNGDVAGHFVSGRLGGDLLASLTLAKPFAIGIDVPFFLAQTGDGKPSFGGLGDIRLVPKIRFVDNTAGGVGFSLLTELRAPSHAGDFAGGQRMIAGSPKLVLDYRSAESLHLAVNVGALIQKASAFYNVEAASEFTYGAAIAYRFGGRNGPVAIGAEALGGVGLAQTDTEEIALEATPFVKFFPGDDWEITAGAGLGVIPGFGVPVARGIFGVRWTPTSHDRDHDGIPDDEDKCPDQAEDRNGYQDADGCPDADKDDDQDGIPNYLDQCPDQKETINGFQDEDGCPDGGPAKVIREDGKFKVLESVKFRSGSSELDPESHNILNQVALTLKANPDIKRMRVEGHTDDTGPHETNMRLSKGRAESVRQYLIARGVKPERLKAEGYGPDKPLVKGIDADSRSKNRRVEFIIE